MRILNVMSGNTQSLESYTADLVSVSDVPAEECARMMGRLLETLALREVINKQDVRDVLNNQNIQFD